VVTFVILASVALALAGMFAGPGREVTRWTSSWAVTSAPVAAFLLVVIIALLWGRQRGLSVAENFWLLFGPTAASALWTTPQVERLLTPLAPRGNRTPPQPGTPHDLLRAISQLASSLVGASREVGTQATSVARQLVGCITELDTEISAFSRDANAGEMARLEERLTGLGVGAAQSVEHDEMRRLLTSQLELMRRIRAQQDVASHRRVHLVDLLQALWTHLTELHGAGDETAAREPAARIRELCAAASADVDQPARDMPDRTRATKGAGAALSSASDARAS
jgi:hypothetical protein